VNLILALMLVPMPVILCKKRASRWHGNNKEKEKVDNEAKVSAYRSVENWRKGGPAVSASRG